MPNKIKVITWAGGVMIGGVDSWLLELKSFLAGDQKYEFIAISDYKNFGGTEKIDLAITSWDRLEEYLKRSAPAIVIPNWRHQVYGICAKLRKQGYKLYCLGTCHSDSVREYYNPLSWYESAISKFIAVSKTCEKKLSSCIPSRKNDIFYLPYGITIPDAFEKDYSCRPVRLIYFGRIVKKQKNIFDLVNLVKHLKSASVDFRLDIYGNGHDKGGLIRMMRMADSDGRVSFHRELPHADMLEKLSEYDVFVLPSGYEGQSLSLIESMARKLIPCVTKDTGGSWSIIEYGKNGFYFEIGDMRSMADAIGNIAGMEKNRLAQLGDNAYWTAKEKFDKKRIFPEFRNILDSCTETGPGQWAHGNSFLLKEGLYPSYMPYDHLCGGLLAFIFRVMPRETIRKIFRKLKIFGDNF